MPYVKYMLSMELSSWNICVFFKSSIPSLMYLWNCQVFKKVNDYVIRLICAETNKCFVYNFEKESLFIILWIYEIKKYMKNFLIRVLEDIWRFVWEIDISITFWIVLAYYLYVDDIFKWNVWWPLIHFIVLIKRNFSSGYLYK